MVTPPPADATGDPGPSSATPDTAVRAGRAVAGMAVAEVVGKVSTLVITVGLARELGLVAFGRFSFALAVGLLLAAVPVWGFDSVVTQRASADRAVLGRLLAELLVLRAGIGTAVLAAFVAAVAPLAGTGGVADVGAAGVFVVAACLVDTVTEAYRAAAAAAGRQQVIAAAHLAQRTVTAALVAAALLAHASAAVVCGGYLAGMTVGPVAAAVLCARRGIRPAWRAIGRHTLGRLCVAAWPMGVVALASVALSRLDTAMLGVLAGGAAVGRYGAAYRLVDTVLFLCFAVTRVLFPLMAGAPTAQRLRRTTETGLAFVAAVFLPYAVLLWLRGAEILRLLFGAGFATDPAVIAWLAPAPLAFGVAYVVGFALVAPGPTARAPLAAGLTLAANVLLNLALVPTLGATGAAAATTLCYALEAVLLALLARRWMPLPRPGRRLLPAVAGTALAAVPLAAPLPLAVALAAAVPAYLAGWGLTARLLDPDQLSLVVAGLTRRHTREARA